MIKFLKVKNFALAKNVEINFQDGFNVLVGETGSGKTIILKSLMFLLGDKFNKTDIRTGESFVRVSAIFESNSPQTKLILSKYDLEISEEIMLTRTTEITGKTECKVNGENVTLTALKELAETFVDYYGQNENQTLLKTANHIAILDSFKPNLLVEQKNKLVVLMKEYSDIKSALGRLGGDNESRARLLDLLDYQITEIEDVNPKINEDIELENKILQIRNAEKIASALQTTVSALKGSFSATENLKNAEKSLINISTYNPEFEKTIEKLNSFYYEIDDIAESLEDTLNSSVYSEIELEKIDTRLDKLKNIKKKYGGSIEEVLKFLDKAKTDKQNLENADEEIIELNKKLNVNLANLRTESAVLSNNRKKIALELESKLKQEFSMLGMKNAVLKVDFKENSHFSANGNDIVEFLFSANLGESLKPLGKTISGGEMSRFMLGLKNILAETGGVSTLIFDEIDTGISGEVGVAIAEKLGSLAKKEQIICITHLPQVCAMANHYYFVSKKAENGSTETYVNKLNDTEILSAIARLSGGNMNSDISIQHARELKNRADNFKKSL